MFRSIGKILDKKKKNLVELEEKSSDISFIFDQFVDEYFTEYKGLFRWKVSYNPKNGKIFINTGSKLIAGELSLKIKELSYFLKRANIRATQIIIT